MINSNIIYLYVIFILHLLSFDGGFGFQSFCQLCRWGATTTQDSPYHSTSLLTTTRLPSPFYALLYRSRDLPLHLTKVSHFPKGEQSKEIKDWLQNRLKLTDKEIKKISNNIHIGLLSPKIIDGDVESAISSRIESLDSRIYFLQTRLNITNKEISKIFTQSNLLSLSSENIAEKLDWLQCRLDLDDTQLSKLVRRSNTILTNSCDNLSPKLTWLEERFDLNATRLRTFVLKNPATLSLQIDSMEDKLTWYKNRFNFPDSEEAVKKIIRRLPQVLGRDLESADKKLTWLQNRLDLTDFQLYKIIQGCPTILTSHVENKLGPKLCFLASRFCLDDSGLRTMVCKQPMLLQYSIDNIDSTMEFYEGILGKDNAIRQIGNVPSYINYSVEGRLKPRLVNVTKLGLVISQHVPLTNLATYTNEEWEEYMKQLS